jgi:hypothetical protein
VFGLYRLMALASASCANLALGCFDKVHPTTCLEDNAVMERFFINLKAERLNYQSFANHFEVVQTVESYISIRML